MPPTDDRADTDRPPGTPPHRRPDEPGRDVDGDVDGGAGDVVCRKADADDWPAIWPIVSRVLAGGDTYVYPPDVSESEARSIWMHDGDREATYVAEIEGRVVATAYLRPNQPGQGAHVANAGWMVDPDVSGRGLGRRLGEFVIDDARRRGFRAMQFNAVVATNAGAVRLWSSLGFAIVGTVPEAFSHPSEGFVDVHVMHRRL